MYCVKCGGELVPEARYCVSCGSAVDSGDDNRKIPTNLSVGEVVGGLLAEKETIQPIGKQPINETGHGWQVNLFWLVVISSVLFYFFGLPLIQEYTTKFDSVSQLDKYSAGDPQADYWEYFQMNTAGSVGIIKWHPPPFSTLVDSRLSPHPFV